MRRSTQCGLLKCLAVLAGLVASGFALAEPSFLPSGRYELAITQGQQRLILETCFTPQETQRWQSFVLAMEAEPDQCQVLPQKSIQPGHIAWQTRCRSANQQLVSQGELSRTLQGKAGFTATVTRQKQPQAGSNVKVAAQNQAQRSQIEGRLLEVQDCSD